MDAGFSLTDLRMFVGNQLTDPRTGVSKRFDLVPFAYPIAYSTAVAAGSFADGFVNILANADFCCTEIWVQGSGTSLIRLMIVDSGSNERYMQNPVQALNYGMGLSDRVNCLPYPRIIAGKTNLQVTLYNYDSTAGFDNPSVVFEGMSIYTYD